MKLNAIKAACIRRGMFCIYNDVDRVSSKSSDSALSSNARQQGETGQQWIGNGCAFWPVDGIVLTEESIGAVFDIAPRKLDKLRVMTMGPDYVEPRVTREPMEGQEVTCQEAGALIQRLGVTYLPLYTDEGVMLLDTGHLKPADNTDGFLSCKMRRNETGNVLIACYGNLFVSAIVAPVAEEVAQEIIDAVRLIGAMPIVPTRGWGPDAFEMEREALLEPRALAGQVALSADEDEEE